MGSGATKINSSEPNVRIERQKSSHTICSEKNNNVTAKLHLSERSTSAVPEPESTEALSKKYSQSQISTQVTCQNSSVQKLPDLHTKKPKDILSETKVMSLKPSPPEPFRKDNEKEREAVTRLNEELAESETQRLDLQEQVQILEEKLLSKGQQQKQSMSANNVDSLQETLNAKDQYILKLEREAKTTQVETNKVRMRLKKRIKALTNQLHETRQEASISQMELKAEITRQAEQIRILKAGGSPSSSTLHDDNLEHSKIIVELSNQLSEQADQISSLEVELSAKKKEISDLKLAISDHYDSKDSAAMGDDPNPHNSVLPHTSTDRLHSSRGRRAAKVSERSSREKKTHGFTDNLNVSPAPLDDGRDSINDSLILHRQSTALSDSDSDWGDHTTPSHTHSAPARSRVKSAISLASSGKHKGSMITLNGNDDSVMDMVGTSPIDSMLENNREIGKKNKSTLKNHLEKARVESQTNSLIGPSLAFERKTEAFSDTSCEPTPRPQRTMLHTDPKVRIVRPILH